MSDTPSRGAPVPDLARRSTYGSWVLVCAIASTIVMTALWISGPPPKGWGTTPVIAVGAMFSGALMLVYVCLPSTRAHEQRLTEQRERVRAAEAGLEDALRVPMESVTQRVVVGGSARSYQVGRDTPIEGEGASPPEGMLLDGRAPQLPLSELWAVTHSRLDLYHEIATGQASRSFRNAQVAMVLGFALLVVFVIVALRASTTAGAVVAGGLGAVAAALAGYVSRTFVRSQEAAASHLRAYFEQPLEFSRYLAAERLVADSNLSDEQRAEVVTELAKAMISGPTPPVGDTANDSNGEDRNARA
ncbi:hypothetical protein [Streptomyces sp. NPDC056512]|uniref:hypothetical protein n=1 Tax=Streptomyces sp. NPDC056512 TaxID=3345846 RepID=UPI003689B358